MLSRRRKTVTGSSVVRRQPNIKPVKARRIIRRFHLLINKRRIVCGKLNVKLIDGSEEANQSHITKELTRLGLQACFKSGWDAEHPSTELEAQMLKAQNINDRSVLVKILGYIMCEIHDRGGLQNYQLASTVGQDKNRGGDSSKILVKWFKEIRDSKRHYRALEIGSLSAKNAISTSGVFDPVVRIDLNSNDPAKIQRQDFMDRPCPQSDGERFDIISCSLVLNFVPTPQLRGAMLVRFREFLRLDAGTTYVFLVLPLPCISNSRYINETVFCEIMEHLGFQKTRVHKSSKIIYFLFESVAKSCESHNCDSCVYTKKRLINDKPDMNNFSILL